MQRNLYIGLIVTAILSVSCRDQLASVYQEINEVKITGIEENYDVLQGAPLKIVPVLDFTVDDGQIQERYQYEWFVAGASRTDLANSRDLDIPVSLPPGEHEVYYRVRDTNTGVQWSTMFSVTVRTSTYEGWMVLNDVDGTARLDMISLIGEDYTPIHDVLAFTGSGLQLEGAPVDINCFPYNNQTYGIYVTAGGTGSTKIHPETFGWEPQMQVSYEGFMDVPDNYGADFIVPKGNLFASYMYKDDNVYYYNQGFGLRYGAPINIVSGEIREFKAAPFVVNVPNGDFAGFGPSILYDETNKRFVNHLNSATSCNVLSGGTLFNYQTGMDLVYMESNVYSSAFAAGQVFAILKEPGTGDYYLARFTLAAFGISYTQTYWSKMEATDIQYAEKFAVSPTYGYIFYNVGGKLYQYDMFAKQSKLMLDKGAGEISLLKFQFFQFPFASATTRFNNKLIVGAYEPTQPAESSGAFELYTVPAVNGDLVLDERHEGFGKIMAVSYRERR